MRKWGWLGLGLSVLAACGSDDKSGTKDDAGQKPSDASMADSSVPLSDRLSADGRFFRDSLGRAVLLRGVNARVEGVFDVTFDDGRKALEDVPALTDDDCKRMAELGFRILRLPTNWSGIEPQKDQFSEAYLQRVDAAIACAKNHGVYVIVDLHQDAYSKEIGEDGAPLWAIEPKPAMLLEGPLTSAELARRRFSSAALNAFNSFFADGDPSGLQAQYIEMLEHVAARYADEPFVIGIDLFNEPVTGADKLQPFQARAAAAVHAKAPNTIVFFEPSGLWNNNGGEAAGGPFPVAGSVYAPHLYKIVIGGSEQQLKDVTRDDLLPSFEAAAQEAQDWGAAWFIGELGGGPSTTNFQTYLKLHYDLQDEFLVSSTLWLWKESSQDSWGMYDFQDGAWKERASMVELVSRPYAVRTAGTPTSMRFDGQSFTLSYEKAVNAANVIFIPERFAVESASCDGNAVTAEVKDHLLEISCGTGNSHEVVVALKPAT